MKGGAKRSTVLKIAAHGEHQPAGKTIAIIVRRDRVGRLLRVPIPHEGEGRARHDIERWLVGIR